jgi:phosphatidylserine/phosphatidylglycerophosphate/cardiolipin synthase-like enzyme
MTEGTCRARTTAIRHLSRSEAQGLSLSFYPGGRERFDALLGLIDGAETASSSCSTSSPPTRAASAVRDALVAAARRGVDVRVIVDGFGAVAGQTFFAPLVEAGGSSAASFPRLTRGYLIRNHQKLVVADGRWPCSAGFNVENAYFAVRRESAGATSALPSRAGGRARRGVVRRARGLGLAAPRRSSARSAARCSNGTPAPARCGC